jgi:hypothetical protein
MIVNYNAFAVKIDNATSSLVRFEMKNIFFNFENPSDLHTYYSGEVMLYIYSKVVILAPVL